MSREVGLGAAFSPYTSLIGVINSVFTIYEPNGDMAHLLTTMRPNSISVRRSRDGSGYLGIRQATLGL